LIIETKYRDISFEEALQCCSEEFLKLKEASKEVWERNRGKLVLIQTPPTTINMLYFKCNGPFYNIVGMKDRYSVCPHLAEIGD